MSPQDNWLITKKKIVNITVEKPGKPLLNQRITVNTTNNEIYQQRLPLI